MEVTVKRLAIAIFGATAALTLGACAGNYGGGYASSDVWYDNFYGPYDAGYWDGDVFVFRDHDGHFTRDAGRHFRHERFASARGFHSMPAPNATGAAANTSATAPAPSPAPAVAPPPMPRPH
jgi:hypothetical protein